MCEGERKHANLSVWKALGVGVRVRGYRLIVRCMERFIRQHVHKFKPRIK